VRLLGEESRGGRARRGRKAGELLAEGDEQGGETSRENRRGGERAVQGRGTSRGREGTHLGGLQASSTGGEDLPGEEPRTASAGGEEIQVGEEQRRLGGARPREDDQRRRGRSSAGLEEQRRRGGATPAGEAPLRRASASGSRVCERESTGSEVIFPRGRLYSARPKKNCARSSPPD